MVLQAIADLAAVAVDRARLGSLAAERSEWFERLAHTDPLTGLANTRTLGRVLELELARAARQGGEVSVALIDVDGLTGVNEASGHEAGDDVLRAVATVLAESVRLVDTVARYGGDEFVLIAPGAAGMTVAQRVLDGVAGAGRAAWPAHQRLGRPRALPVGRGKLRRAAGRGSRGPGDGPWRGPRQARRELDQDQLAARPASCRV